MGNIRTSSTMIQGLQGNLQEWTMQACNLQECIDTIRQALQDCLEWEFIPALDDSTECNLQACIIYASGIRASLQDALDDALPELQYRIPDACLNSIQACLNDAISAMDDALHFIPAGRMQESSDALDDALDAISAGRMPCRQALDALHFGFIHQAIPAMESGRQALIQGLHQGINAINAFLDSRQAIPAGQAGRPDSMDYASRQGLQALMPALQDAFRPALDNVEFQALQGWIDAGCPADCRPAFSAMDALDALQALQGFLYCLEYQDAGLQAAGPDCRAIIAGRNALQDALDNSLALPAMGYSSSEWESAFNALDDALQAMIALDALPALESCIYGNGKHYSINRQGLQDALQEFDSLNPWMMQECRDALSDALIAS